VSELAESSDPLVVIPARFASSRFPGKPLADLGGQTVLRRCYERVLKVVDSSRIVVATDDERIANECAVHGMNFVMTSSECLTGTDRVAEVATKIAADWYINVQGDEPFLDPTAVEALHSSISAASESVQVINAHAPISEEVDFKSATVPKVVTDLSGRLLYISRAAIPTTKQLEFRGATRQIGMYAFRRRALELFSSRTRKTPLEELEDIEILRFLEMGVEVRMIEVTSGGIAIDTPDDLARARRILDSRS